MKQSKYNKTSVEKKLVKLQKENSCDIDDIAKIFYICADTRSQLHKVLQDIHRFRYITLFLYP